MNLAAVAGSAVELGDVAVAMIGKRFATPTAELFNLMASPATMLSRSMRSATFWLNGGNLVCGSASSFDAYQ